jgi:hypothetical protein
LRNKAERIKACQRSCSACIVIRTYCECWSWASLS